MRKTLMLIHSLLWGAPVLMLILWVGIFLSWRTGFVQITLFPKAVRSFFSMLFQRGKRDVSPFRALCTALAATVGTGNLVGVAGAICIGGPGAVFWMWLCGVLGMITKCAEVTLAVHYRIRRNGEYLGGPMYMISRGMGDRWKPMARAYAILGMVAALGVGNGTQINAVVTGINSMLGSSQSFRRDLAFGLMLCVLVGVLLFGGAGRIGAVAERLVPFVATAYILLCVGALIYNADRICDAFLSIVRGAFSPGSITGGAVGAGFQALKVGCSRGVFTNEAGMGTASIAHASADAMHPVEQGLFGIVEVFLDTIVICTLTALLILTSGVYIPYGEDIGGQLTLAAFSSVYGNWSDAFITAALCCFAIATVLGWGLYGGRCAQFLFGRKAWDSFALLQTLAVIPGAVLKTDTIWLLSEIFNGLMAIPNLICLAVLSPRFFRLITEYRIKTGIPKTGGGNHADFHQCKPL